MPKGLPTWRNQKNQAHFQNGSFDQIVTHLKRELELNSLEVPDESQMNSVTQNNKLKARKIILENLTVTQSILTPTETKVTERL